MIKIKIMTLVATMTRTTSYLITSRVCYNDEDEDDDDDHEEKDEDDDDDEK